MIPAAGGRQGAIRNMTRYNRTDDVLELALRLASSYEGLSLDDIKETFGVSRSTAERMREAVGRVFPNLDFATGEDRVRRWRLPQVPSALVQITAEELAEIDAAAKNLRRRGLEERAQNLDHAARKLRALAKRQTLSRIDADLELLMESEGLAMRPGPRPKFVPGLLSEIRQALLANRLVRLRYNAPERERPLRPTLEPHGILYGARPYLVAPLHGDDLMRLWRLDRIAKVTLLDETFVRRADFNLEEFAARSFGVFQEEPVDVVWKFKPEAAADARNWLFHPTQTMEDLPDGSLLVKFRAGGQREMDWHLYTWGDAVGVVKSSQLDLLTGNPINK